MTDDKLKPPVKLVKDNSTLIQWLRSPAFNQLMKLIMDMNEAVKSKSYSKIVIERKMSIYIDFLVDCISQLYKLVEKYPPAQQSQRFGNKSYRSWHAAMNKIAPSLLERLLNDEMKKKYLQTLLVYFCDSFGDSTRIDYGTGHETNLFFFICCLSKIGVIDSNDYGHIVACFFTKYLELVRHLQNVYKMEPAGSHGVWGLDDFQFLPFLFGSSQLINNQSILPSMYIEPDFVHKNKTGYMFLEAIENINQTKKGPFFEHSSYLYNISAVADWTKVNKGLIVMYQKEVLSKLPIVQHFYFGYLMPLS